MADIQTAATPLPASYVYQRLWVLRSADMTLTSDQAFTKLFSGTVWVPAAVVAKWVSGAFSIACAGGVYTSASKGGNAIIAAAQVYSALTGSLTSVMPALALTTVQNSASLFLSLTTGNSAALTADFFVYGLVVD